MDPPPSGFEPPQKSVPKLIQVGWRAMLIFNLGLGAYMFAKKREKDIDAGDKKRAKKGSEARHKGGKKAKEDAENSKVADTDNAKEADSVIAETKPILEPDPLLEFTDEADQVVFQTLTSEPVKVARKPIPEDEQRELFNWILEEKRKMKPKDRKEKKRIDEDKAILKQFIRAERISKLLPDDSVDSSLRDWDKFFSK